MKGSKYEFDGCEYTLCYTGAAKFAIDEIIGGEDLSAALLPKTVEGFERLCKAAAILSEQAELVRRYYGYDNAETLDAEQIMLLLPPTEQIDLYNAVMAAIILGCNREIADKDRTISLTRQRMLKKKESD